jgi:hypothetical protein
VINLIEEKVMNVNDFEWISQVKENDFILKNFKILI